MITVTGTYNKRNNIYRLHSTTFPYTPKTYVGYTWAQVQKKFRIDEGLQGKKIEWIIL